MYNYTIYTYYSYIPKYSLSDVEFEKARNILKIYLWSIVNPMSWPQLFYTIFFRRGCTIYDQDVHKLKHQ